MRRNLKNVIRWLIFSFIPLAVGLGFIYVMIPGAGRGFLSVYGGNGWIFLTFVFLFPFSGSQLSWLAWIISGFVGGLLFRGILIPFIFTLGYAWVIIYFGGSSSSVGFLTAFLTARMIILNTLVAGISFLFGGWIGSSIRPRIEK